MMPRVTPRAELAPTGKLRAGINYGNFLLVLSDGPDGAPRGIAPDLGREIARQLGVPVEFVRFQQAGELADGAKAGLWDIGFLGSEPQRAAEIAFSPAYLEIPVTYLVPAASPIRTLSDIDREGLRIAVSGNSAYDLFLSRTLKHAQLVRAEGIEGSYRLFIAQKLDALAGLKPRLVAEAERLPGARVLEGQATGVQQAIGTPRGRGQAAAKYLHQFVEEAKASGLIAKMIEAHGVRGVTVAPKAPAQ
jgi:polar amino acid transport system substrate-binding protein